MHVASLRLHATRAALTAVMLATTAFVQACSGVTGPPFPDDAVPMNPAAPFRRWWALTEQCSGLSGDFTSVRWFTVRRPTIDVRDDQYDAYWYQKGNRIVVAERYALNGEVIRHEMLHALLRSGSHPSVQFTDHCGGVVSFGDDLHRLPASGKSLPAADAPIVDASALLLTGDVSPDPVSAGTPDSGWVSASVLVTNPLDVPVRVRLSLIDALNPYRRTFGFLVVSTDSLAFLDGATFFADSLMPFGPRETKRQVFDAQLSPRVGGWRLRASFNGNPDAWRPFTLVP